MPTGQSDLGNSSPELPSVEMPSHLKTTRDWEFGVVWGFVWTNLDHIHREKYKPQLNT